MNDRNIGLLDQYELEVNRTWKGRGCILCDTAQGLKTLKKYEGPREKIKLQNLLLMHIKESGVCLTEQIVPNREGELLTIDTDGSAYVVKDFFQGQECNIRDGGECRTAVTGLAKLHKALELHGLSEEYGIGSFQVEREFEKHTRELRKARKYIRQKRQKSDFERFLMNHYDSFYQRAEEITQEAGQETAGAVTAGCFCHGDYQHHNLIVTPDGIAAVNFEKCTADHQMRDLCLFLRKLLEKSNWNQSIGFELLEVYHQEKPLNRADWKQIYYRLAYPEKFWKIVNFYFNSGKAWIPEKNMEKLEKLLQQEENRNLFLEQVARTAANTL